LRECPAGFCGVCRCWMEWTATSSSSRALSVVLECYTQGDICTSLKGVGLGPTYSTRKDPRGSKYKNRHRYSYTTHKNTAPPPRVSLPLLLQWFTMITPPMTSRLGCQTYTSKMEPFHWTVVVLAVVNVRHGTESVSCLRSKMRGGVQDLAHVTSNHL
jgi:hypothetical protein